MRINSSLFSLFSLNSALLARFVLLAALALPLSAQSTLRWFATTGDTVLSGAGTSATIQQPATNQSQSYIDQAVVYCSVACNVTLAANGTAATSTAGTVTPLLPTPTGTPIPVTFWTASNVGTGTSQGGITHIPAGGTVTLCFTPSCGNPAQLSLGAGQGAAANFTVTIGTVTGTVNVSIYGRSIN
jgi:hypothetical protein